MTDQSGAQLVEEINTGLSRAEATDPKLARIATRRLKPIARMLRGREITKPEHALRKRIFK